MVEAPIPAPVIDLARHQAVRVVDSGFADPAARGLAPEGREGLVGVAPPEGVAPVGEITIKARARSPGFYFARRLARVIKA